MARCPECGGSSIRKSRRHVRAKSASRPFSLWLRCNRCGARFLGTYWRRVGRWVGLGVAAVVLLVVTAGPRTPGRPAPSATEMPPAAGAGPTGFGPETLDAADRGDREAQYRMGLALIREYREQGRRESLGEGLAWLHRAAEQGDPRAQFEMGTLYETGNGALQDFAEAAQWFRRSAEGGHPGAMFRLGQMAGTGRGQPKSLVEAYVWLNLAAARGEAAAGPVRDQVAALLAADQLSEAQERSRHLHARLPGGTLTPAP